jgi:hypothetical protein
MLSIPSSFYCNFQSIEAMLEQRNRLMKCIERCRKRERLDEKVDPFLVRWGLQELPGTAQGEETDDPSSLYVPPSAEPEGVDGLTFNPKKIEHIIDCDCNPCTCAVEEDPEDKLPDGVAVSK